MALLKMSLFVDILFVESLLVALQRLMDEIVVGLVVAFVTLSLLTVIATLTLLILAVLTWLCFTHERRARMRRPKEEPL